MFHLNLICFTLTLYVLILSEEKNEHYRIENESENCFNEVRHALTSNGIGPTLPDICAMMPNMGFRIAKRYKHVVVLLSIEKGRS